jgi:dihydropteroate synthase
MRMRTIVMGVLNMTPDSFSDGGRYQTLEAALEQARKMIGDGADIIDVGGESTRPGAAPVAEDVEMQRVLPVIAALADEGLARVSIDTMKPAVAEAAVRAGASLINDVTGLRDEEMARVAARGKAGVVVMHMRGTPATMREHAVYGDLMAEIAGELRPRVELARRTGVEEIWVDPGIGFAKTPAQSFEILRRLEDMAPLGCPVLVGPSRKSFLATLPGMTEACDREEGTVAAAVIAAMNGAAAVRVHEVRAVRKALSVAEAVRRS